MYLWCPFPDGLTQRNCCATFLANLSIGVRAYVDFRQADRTDRIVALCGVDPKWSYKQTLVQWCFEGVAPPLDVEVSDLIPTPAGDGKVCYVLYTMESELGPHFLNGRRGVYVRTDEFTSRFEPKLATENELCHLLDRRKLVM